MISILKDLLSKDNCYSIGIRKRNQKEGLLFEGNLSPFTILPISEKEWYADPIVFSKEGIDYLFCEVYDRKKERGNIGYTILNSVSPSKPKIVLKLNRHLSYPCVFEKDDCIYMIPETTTQKSIELYKAVDFPEKWEFVCILKEGGEYADSTMFIDDDYQLLLTFEQFKGDGSITKLHVFDATNIENGELKNYPCKRSFEFTNYSRGAGKIFEWNADLSDGLRRSSSKTKFKVSDEIIKYNAKHHKRISNMIHRGGYCRAAQICTPEYGYALNFMKLDLEGGYDEEIISTVYPESIQSDFHKKIIGIHTYTLTDHFEIIDIKFDDTRLRYQIRRVYRHLLRKVLKR